MVEAVKVLDSLPKTVCDLRINAIRHADQLTKRFSYRCGGRAEFDRTIGTVSGCSGSK